jgi:hypothetical protein
MDDDVGPLHGSSDRVDIADVARDRCQLRVIGWTTRECDDLGAPRQQAAYDTPAEVSAGSSDQDPHDSDTTIFS